MRDHNSIQGIHIMTNFINQVAQLTRPHVEHLVKNWLPGGEQQGHEWVVRNPTRQDHNPGSFKVNLETGRWADFATGEAGGDMVSLRAYLDRDRQPGCMLRAAYAVAAALGIDLRALGHATVPPRFFIFSDLTATILCTCRYMRNIFAHSPSPRSGHSSLDGK
jgi:hypothetical protein